MRRCSTGCRAFRKLKLWSLVRLGAGGGDGEEWRLLSRQTPLVTSSSCSQRLRAGEAGGYRARFRSRSKLQSGNAGRLCPSPSPSLPFPALPFPEHGVSVLSPQTVNPLSCRLSVGHSTLTIGDRGRYHGCNFAEEEHWNQTAPVLFVGVTAVCVEDQGA